MRIGRGAHRAGGTRADGDWAFVGEEHELVHLAKVLPNEGEEASEQGKGWGIYKAARMRRRKKKKKKIETELAPSAEIELSAQKSQLVT